MEFRSDRQYQFGVDPATLWATIAEVDDYRHWWPWLRAFHAQGLVSGDTWQCVVQPPLPYSLRFTISLDEVVRPQLVNASIAGDVTGAARLELEHRENGCQARLTSALSPGNKAFRIVASLARPLVHRGHDWVLNTGASQFAARAM